MYVMTEVGTRKHRRAQIRRSQRGYYRRNAKRLREEAVARDARNPEGKRTRNERFEANNPTYWREFYHRRKLRLAWLKWASTCAASRNPPREGGE